MFHRESIACETGIAIVPALALGASFPAILVPGRQASPARPPLMADEDRRHDGLVVPPTSAYSAALMAQAAQAGHARQ